MKNQPNSPVPLKHAESGRNFYCDNCNDTGRILLGFRSCPQCEGDPESYWKRTHSEPNPKPQNSEG